MNYTFKIFILAVCFFSQGVWSTTSAGFNISQETPKPLVVVNGYIVRYTELVKIKDEMIESKTELDSEQGFKIFGESGKDGAIVIVLKRKIVNSSVTKVDEQALKQIEELTSKKESAIKNLNMDEKSLLEGATYPEVAIQLKDTTKQGSLAEAKVVSEFSNQLQIEFEKSIKNPRIKTIKLNGKEVTKEQALKVNVFDVDTAVSTYKENNSDGILEIYTIKK